MGKGRSVGTKNIFQYKYQLILPNGDFILYKSQNEISENYKDVSRTKLNKIVNHPCLVTNAPFRVIKLKPPLPVFDKYFDEEEERFKYRTIIYDTKGNQVQHEQTEV